MSEPRIVGAAIHLDGNTYWLEAPARHGDVMAALCKLGQKRTAVVGDQGFVTQNGDFLTRRDARQVAERYGQLKPNALKHDELFSEDVW